MSDDAGSGGHPAPLAGPQPTRAELLAKCRAAHGAARRRRIRPLQGASARRRGGGGGAGAALPALDTPPFQAPAGAPTLDQMLTVFEQCDQDLGKLCDKLGLPPGMVDVVHTALADVGENGTMQQALERTMALTLERIGVLTGSDTDAHVPAGASASAELTDKVDELLAQAGVVPAVEATAREAATDVPTEPEHD